MESEFDVQDSDLGFNLCWEKVIQDNFEQQENEDQKNLTREWKKEDSQKGTDNNILSFPDLLKAWMQGGINSQNHTTKKKVEKI